MEERRRSKTNWDKSLESKRRNYSVDPWEISFTEIVTNSEDARASKIYVNISSDNDGKIEFYVMDNGNGMDEVQFGDYHDMHSLDKDIRDPSVGMIGQGAKLCLDIVEEVRTHTKKKGGKILASDGWCLELGQSEAYCNFKIKPVKKFRSGWISGTIVEVRGLQAEGFDLRRLYELLMENFAYSLPPYGDHSIYLDEKTLVAYEGKSEHDFTGSNYNGSFFLSDTPVGGIHIVIRGKTITRDNFFSLESQIKEDQKKYISGFVRCDDLKMLVSNEKDSFIQRRDSESRKLWNNFISSVAKDFKRWLKDNGLYLEPIVSKHTQPSLLRWNNKLNKLIPRLPPNLRDLFPLPSKTIERKKIVVDTTIEGIYYEKEILIISENRGGGGDKPGPGNKKANLPKDGGNRGTKKRKTKRRVYETKVVRGTSRKDLGWWDETDGFFAINGDHPAYLKYTTNGTAEELLYSTAISQYIMSQADPEEWVDNLWSFYSNIG